MDGSETKRGNDIRVGHGPALGEGCVSEALGNGASQKAVVLHGLVGETEETEEDERANDSSPSGDLQRIDETRVPFQQYPGGLEDA